MTSSENLFQLQRALKGKARETVGLFLMETTQVPETIDIVEHQYDSTGSIAKLMMEKTRTLPYLTTKISLEELADLSGTIKHPVPFLRILKTNGYLI